MAQMPTFDEMFSVCSGTEIETEEFLPPLGWRQQDRAGVIVHSSGLFSSAIAKFGFDQLTESLI